ncbi:MAG TPA: NfeD family protein [Candidatus Bathyarchaeia archaeon]|nr:NfeD family protein [Candidatus Bathyarchaeia archaeon]
MKERFRHARRISILVLALFIFLTLQSSLSPPVRASSSYYVAAINANIDPGTEDFVVSSINDATSQGIHNFVLVLDTFGGNGQNMDNIITAISKYRGAGNNFTALIAPFGAHAFSAGAYIAEASTNITIVPGTTIGSATPIVYGIPVGEENTTLTKDINGFTAFMVSITPSYRNSNGTALMVTKGRSFSCQAINNCEALSNHVVDKVINVASTNEALLAICGSQCGDIHTPGIRSSVLSILSDPNLDGILFLLGTFAILADVYHPTIVISVVGAAAIALALVGLGVFGASIVSIILMLIGALFIFFELKTHHGISATIGVVIFIVGFILVFSLPAPAPGPNQPTGTLPNPVIGILTYIILGLVGGGVVFGSVYLYKIREATMRQPLSINPKAIIGKEGYLTSDVKAGEYGTATISSEDYTVTSSESLSKGTKVRVKDVQGLKLVVERREA